MRGPQDNFINANMSLKLVNVRTSSSVPRVDDDYFFLDKIGRNSVAVMLKKTIIGPQDIELQLKTALYSKGTYVGFNISKMFIHVSQYDF
jgi:fibulin 1/2